MGIKMHFSLFHYTNILLVGRNDGWTLINESGTVVNSAYLFSSTGIQYFDNGSQIRFLSAPLKFLGNQLNSYGQRFLLQVGLWLLAYIYL